MSIRSTLTSAVRQGIPSLGGNGGGQSDGDLDGQRCDACAELTDERELQETAMGELCEECRSYVRQLQTSARALRKQGGQR